MIVSKKIPKNYADKFSKKFSIEIFVTDNIFFNKADCIKNSHSKKLFGQNNLSYLTIGSILSQNFKFSTKTDQQFKQIPKLAEKTKFFHNKMKHPVFIQVKPKV